MAATHTERYPSVPPIGEQSGLYGVFDGHADRVWLGLEPFQGDGNRFSYVDIGPDWRDKLYWNEFVDRISVEHLQYPFVQRSELTPVDGGPLVTDAAAETTGEVYEIDTEQLSTTARHRFQLWRPTGSQIVFVAVDQLAAVRSGFPRPRTRWFAIERPGCDRRRRRVS